MFEEQHISDYRQLAFLQKYLSTHHEPNLKSLYNCGHGILPMPFSVPGVFVLKNNENKTKFKGTLSCRNSWACPKCTAKVMAKQAAKIACLIDALAKQQNRYACMITFTIPHIKTMSCKTTYKILQETWRAFTKFTSKRKKTYILKNNEGERGKKGGALGVGKSGTKKTYEINQNTYCKFINDLDIQHHVAVYEFTWGENSWHPHIHALFWTPKKKFNDLLKYEESLNKFWWKCFHAAAKKITNEEFANELCSKSRRAHDSVTISRKCDDNNKPKIQLSSFYVSGWQGSKWSADKELTRLQHKTTKNGHYTPFQILELAQQTQTTDPEQSQKWMDLFIEYALATRKTRRVNFTKNCNKIAIQWQKTHAYAEELKKKLTFRIKENWQVVYWFQKEQWYKICLLEMTNPKLSKLRADILDKLRTSSIEEFENFLKEIDPSLINHKEHPHADFWIESSIFGGLDKIANSSQLAEEIKRNLAA